MAYLHCNFFSEALEQATSMDVLLPEGIQSCTSMESNFVEGDFPVLYLLHGYSGDDTVWMRYTALERYAGKYPLAIVMPRGNHGFYVDGDWGYNYYTFITEELPQKVKHFFNVSSRREDTFIAGLSMGGYGTLRCALGRPDLYAAAASMSGFLDVEAAYHGNTMREHARNNMGGTLEEIQRRDHDLLQLLEKNVKAGVELPKLYITGGTEDRLYQHSVHMREKCKELGVPLTYTEAPGVHDWIYWDQAIQDILAWLPIREG